MQECGFIVELLDWHNTRNLKFQKNWMKEEETEKREVKWLDFTSRFSHLSSHI